MNESRRFRRVVYDYELGMICITLQRWGYYTRSYMTGQLHVHILSKCIHTVQRNGEV
jgi:hypothetical protein